MATLPRADNDHLPADPRRAGQVDPRAGSPRPGARPRFFARDPRAPMPLMCPQGQVDRLKALSKRSSMVTSRPKAVLSLISTPRLVMSSIFPLQDSRGSRCAGMPTRSIPPGCESALQMVDWNAPAGQMIGTGQPRPVRSR